MRLGAYTSIVDLVAAEQRYARMETRRAWVVQSRMESHCMRLPEPETANEPELGLEALRMVRRRERNGSGEQRARCGETGARRR